MSLVKKPTMSDKKIAANRRNIDRAQGLRTEQGREGLGAAHLRHGVYAKAQTVALRSLGEDPAQFKELLEGLCEEFTPVGSLQEQLVMRLARTLWLVDRADRVQEGHTLRQARSADQGRENRLHARMMRLRMTAGSLQSLARSVALEHYVTRPNDLELMKGLQQEPELGEMGGIAYALFCQLQDPGAVDDLGRPTATYEQQRQVLLRIKEIFGLAGDHAPQSATGQPADDLDGAGNSKSDPFPHITAQQWDEREPVRQLLENILTHQAELCEAQRQRLLKDAVGGLSLYERAAESAPSPTDALLMRRLQDANMREVRRVTNMLLKMKRVSSKPEVSESIDAPAYHDVTEKKEG